MKVLLYVEPYPIRETLTHFDGIAKNFLPLLGSSDNLDIRLFANKKTIESLDDCLLPIHKTHLVPATADEDALIQSHLLPWKSEGIAEWRKLMDGSGTISDDYLQILQRLHDTFAFDVIVHWGENGAITRFIETHSVTRVAMELGCTRPPFLDSLVMDPYGTNGSSVVSRLSIDDLREIVGNRGMSRHEALFNYCHKPEAEAYSQQFEPCPIDISARLPRDRVVYFPLQLYDDANLLRFSPYESLVDMVLDVVPRLAEKGYTTIVKPHPASMYRNGSIQMNRLARRALRTWSDRVIWSESQIPIANSRLFSLADFVVTANSSVGFEALFFDKPVVPLGDAVYKPRDVFPSFDEMLDGTFEHETYLKNIAILRRFMLEGYLQPKSAAADRQSFSHRIGLIDEAYRCHSTRPPAFAERFWNACAPTQQAFARATMLRGTSTPGTGDFQIPPILPAPARTIETDEDTQAETFAAYRPIVRRLLQESAAQTLDGFVDWLDTRWENDEERPHLIEIGGFVDSDYYLDRYPDVKSAGIPATEHFRRSGIKEMREPSARIKGLGIEETLRLLKETARHVLSSLALADFLLTSEHEIDVYRKIVSRLLLNREFDSLDSFSRWLDAKWASPTGKLEVANSSYLVDHEFYLATYTDVRVAHIKPTEHFMKYGIHEGRISRRDVKPVTEGALLALLKLSAGDIFKYSCLPTVPLPQAEERSRSQQLSMLRKKLNGSKSRIAVVAHLYYRDLTPAVLQSLQAIAEPFDLVVTMPNWGTSTIKELVAEKFPQAVVYETPNRGRDIAPFIDVLPALIDKKYDAVLKIQTKRGYYRAGRLVPHLGDTWREETCQSLLGTKERTASIIAAFRQDKTLTMIGSEPYLLRMADYPTHDHGNIGNYFLKNLSDAGGNFFAGTMFWVRPGCLKALSRFTMHHFAPEDGATDGALAHTIERIFGQAATANGARLAAAPVDPAASLNDDPQPSTIKIDTYLTNAAQERRTQKKTSATA